MRANWEKIIPVPTQRTQEEFQSYNALVSEMFRVQVRRKCGTPEMKQLTRVWKETALWV